MQSATLAGTSASSTDHMHISDGLTGRPNRCLLLDRLQQAMKRCCRSDRIVVVLYIDIDYFRQVNETHGHDAGDAVLRTFADRLTAAVRATDTVARLREDDFVVLMEDVQAVSDTAIVVDKILESIRQPLTACGTAVHITTSIGVAVYKGEPLDAEYVLNQADQALYRAKNNGRNQVSY